MLNQYIENFRTTVFRQTMFAEFEKFMYDTVENDEVFKMYTTLIEGYNANFNHVEQVKKFVLMPQEWTIDSGELTPKLSMKRKVIMEKFSEQIKNIYQ